MPQPTPRPKPPVAPPTLAPAPIPRPWSNFRILYPMVLFRVGDPPYDQDAQRPWRSSQ